MKLSRYNIEKKEDKSCLIYNTVTSAILELDTDYEKSYYEMKEGKKCSKPDLESALLEGGMLVEDDKDEFAELLIRNKIERFADSNLTLTIAPTMACNFCCPYCYEKGREYITMSETVQDQLTSQLKEKYQHIHELTVSWYGGEPLLAIETIEKLTKKIKSVLPLGCKYNADMVTNGYKLTRRVAEKLKDMDIHYIQVTLDGSKQAHDSRRILHTIYNNIALYRKLDVKCIQRAVDCFGDSILKRDNWDLQINEKSSNISGGEKQKIAIIRQVVQDGQVMIFDEPTSAMDESGKKQFLQLIDQIKNHKIIIIVSHDNAILNTCDEILIL